MKPPLRYLAFALALVVIRVEVTDDGQGITSEDVPKIFRPFEHGGSSPGRIDAELGLGLAVAYTLVQAHGGSLTVESGGVDRGSTFRVCLFTACEP